MKMEKTVFDNDGEKEKKNLLLKVFAYLSYLLQVFLR